LVLLPLAVALAQLATLAVEDLAGQPVAGLLQVELRADLAAVRLVGVDEGEQVQRLGDAAVLGQRPSQRGRPPARWWRSTRTSRSLAVLPRASRTSSWMQRQSVR